MTIKVALETMLKIAEFRLEQAVNKNDAWGIAHYTNDVKLIKDELYDITKK